MFAKVFPCIRQKCALYSPEPIFGRPSSI